MIIIITTTTTKYQVNNINNQYIMININNNYIMTLINNNYIIILISKYQKFMKKTLIKIIMNKQIFNEKRKDSINDLKHNDFQQRIAQ